MKYAARGGMLGDVGSDQPRVINGGISGLGCVLWGLASIASAASPK